MCSQKTLYPANGAFENTDITSKNQMMMLSITPFLSVVFFTRIVENI